MSGESTFGEEMYVLTDGRLLIEFADGWRSPAATSAPGLRSPPFHIYWAHRCHICTGTAGGTVRAGGREGKGY